MNIVRFIQTSYSSMGKIAIEPGQLIHCPDNRSFSFDTDTGERITVADVITVQTKAQLTALAKPISGKLYLVLENYNLYTYNGSWKDISSKPENIALSQLSQNLQTQLNSVISTCNSLSNNYYTQTQCNNNFLGINATAKSANSVPWSGVSNKPTLNQPQTYSWTQTTGISTFNVSTYNINYKSGDVILFFINGLMGQPGYSYNISSSGVITKLGGGSWGLSSGGDYLTLIKIPANNL